jgi:hypothetical protein
MVQLQGNDICSAPRFLTPWGGEQILAAVGANSIRVSTLKMLKNSYNVFYQRKIRKCVLRIVAKTTKKIGSR